QFFLSLTAASTPDSYSLSLHDALPISRHRWGGTVGGAAVHSIAPGLPRRRRPGEARGMNSPAPRTASDAQPSPEAALDALRTGGPAALAERLREIGRASCREAGETQAGGGR